ncbi:MAG TPA: cell wall hydrolase [Caulobacteraceae bacterium]|jgi:hypothetical protein|nr:cell wall hydrolase [Caulobacteraceae bacterium]
METDPWTGQALPDADSPKNANIASIAGQLRRGFIGDPLTGEGGAIPGYGQVHALIGDPFSIRAAHDGMDGTLFSGDPSAFNGAWFRAQTPAEQAAARAAVGSEIQDRIENGQILPGQLGAPDAQDRLATMFGPDQARAIAANGEAAINARLGVRRGGLAPGQAGVSGPWLDNGVAPGAGFSGAAGDGDFGQLMPASFMTPAPGAAPRATSVNISPPPEGAGSSHLGYGVGDDPNKTGVAAGLGPTDEKHPIPTTLGPNNYKPQPGDEDLLARMIYAETSDIPQDSAAIGWSIMNRTGDLAFGKTLTDVMNQKNAFAFVPGSRAGPKGSGQWQASANPAALTDGDAASWAAANQAAAGILNGSIPDPTGAATEFFSSKDYNGNPATAKPGFPGRLERGTIVPSPYTSRSTQAVRNYFFVEPKKK